MTLNHTLIYDFRFKVKEEISMTIVWISFSNLLPIFFVKGCLLYLVATVDKPIQLDQATIYKSLCLCKGTDRLKK